MTNFPSSDSFDQRLDDLADGGLKDGDDDITETAAWLHRHFSVPEVNTVGLNAQKKTAIRDRTLLIPTATAIPKLAMSRRSDALGIAAGPATTIPMYRRSAWRVASIISAAILVLLAVAVLGALLRLDDNERVPGVSATASMMPFAPASVLASPTPVAGCTTTDTLLLTPVKPPEAETFADLPFAVAWYRDGMLTVERQGEITRTIDIGDADQLRPTTVANVIFATTDGPNREGTLINIMTGEAFQLGPYEFIRSAEGPYVFWASDTSLAIWHVVDLRSFETVNLNEQFNVTPLEPWTQYYSPMTSSNDGTVLLLSTKTIDLPYGSTAPATPVLSNGPELQIKRDALLINGSLESISVVGPVAVSSGAMALSPDGQIMAWLAPSDQGGERVLTIVDTTTRDVIHTKEVEATFDNSLLFSADSTVLYSTSGDTLERIAIQSGEATPVTTEGTITLPEAHYRIAAATPDRTRLLLARWLHTEGESSIWLNLENGELRKFEGTPGRLWESTYPASVAPSINTHVLLADYREEASVLDMNTGEIVVTSDWNRGNVAFTISGGSTTLALPEEDHIVLFDLVTARTTSYSAPEQVNLLPQVVALSSEGSCTALTWVQDNDVGASVLISSGSDAQMPLPPSGIGGWQRSGDSGP